MEDLIESLIKSVEDRETIGDRFKINLSNVVCDAIASLFPKEEVDKIPTETRYSTLIFAFLDTLPESQRETFRPFLADIFNSIHMKETIKKDKEKIETLKVKIKEEEKRLDDISSQIMECQNTHRELMLANLEESRRLMMNRLFRQEEDNPV
jgi:septal ring factor EnvC (AmiA/AmiB activator)